MRLLGVSGWPLVKVTVAWAPGVVAAGWGGVPLLLLWAEQCARPVCLLLEALW